MCLYHFLEHEKHLIKYINTPAFINCSGCQPIDSKVIRMEKEYS